MLRRIASFPRHRPGGAIRAPAAALLGLLAVVPTACEGDPFGLDWRLSRETATLFSVDRPEFNLNTGMDFRVRQVVDISDPAASGGWDVLVATRDGEIVFFTPTALGIASEAAIAVIPDSNLDTVVRAPPASEFITDAPVPAVMGNAYVVRTRRQTDLFGFTCVYYAEFEIVSVDLLLQTVRIRFDVNPFCEGTDLDPPLP